jgi:hypothetical protein
VRVFMIIGIVLTVLGIFFLYQMLQPSGATGPFGVDIMHSAAPILALTFLPMGIIFTAVGYYFVRSAARQKRILQQGLAGTATVLGLASTNMYVNEQPVAKLTLSVQLPGRAPYTVERREVVPLLALAMIAPGSTVAVAVDPADPQKVVIDWSGQTQNRGVGQGSMGMGLTPPPPAGMPAPNTLSSMGSTPATPNTLSAVPAATALGVVAADSAPSSVVTPSGGMEFGFDASGQPLAGETAAVVAGVRSGALHQIKGSAAALLATGTRGTAIITTTQPMGQTVRDIDPAADPGRLNDPMWLFTTQVTVPGEAPFPAVFGHRVPLDKVSALAPGVNLAVAVDLADRMNEVAIDWDHSPITG